MVFVPWTPIGTSLLDATRDPKVDPWTTVGLRSPALHWVNQASTSLSPCAIAVPSYSEVPPK